MKSVGYSGGCETHNFGALSLEISGSSCCTTKYCTKCPVDLPVSVAEYGLFSVCRCVTLQ